MSSDRLRQEVAKRLRQSRKYRHLCEDTLLRTADWALLRHPDPREATKAAKRKLHQACGAYFSEGHSARLEGLLDGLSPDLPEAHLRAVCREVLECHASTAERLPFMELFYPALFEEIGRPRTLLDIGCGLNPFSLPWMGLGAGARYCAWDSDGRIVCAVNRLFACTGQGPGAECRDLLVSPPAFEADAAFLFKCVPCLEQQEKGATVRLIKRLRTPCAVVSFPARSIGGADRGMVRHYASEAVRIAEEVGASVRQMAYPSETFYVLRRRI